MKPPREIPQHLYDSFTMNKKVKVEYVYQDDRPHDGHPQIYKKEMIESCLRQIEQKKAFYYGETNIWLYRALEKFGINRKQVAIFGSRTPFYESVCLFYGGHPTTIEHNRIISEDPRLTVMTVEEYKENPIVFDAAFSISSFEHDGLGGAHAH